MQTDLINHDLNQRQMALKQDESFIVQAPAGSGKTELLIQRMLVLLACVDKPEEVLAITFTKKAANEMRERVMQALIACSKPCPEEKHKQQTWHLANKVISRDKEKNWQIIDNPNQLRIQTIDSLCAYLTRQLPILSKFGAPPELAEKPLFLYQAAVSEVISHIDEKHEWSLSIKRLLLHLDNDMKRLQDLFVNMLAKRDQWLSHIHLEGSSDEIKDILEENIQLVIQDHLTLLCQLFPSEMKKTIIDVAIFTENNLQTNRNIDLSTFPENNIEDLDTWKLIANLLLTKDGGWRKQLKADIGFPALAGIKNREEKNQHTEIRKQLLSVIEILSESEVTKNALVNLQQLPNAYIEESQWLVLADLIQVLKILTAQLRLVFQVYGQIDFTENSLGALEALGHLEQPSDLSLALDYQIKHILIDEFQDTSSTQFSLVKMLTAGWEQGDERTLFVVGDPMQSIYRFREAEVGLFIRMRETGIGNIRLTPLVLALNFRSTPEIIEWNNKHFKSIFPSYTDFSTGAVNYSPSVPPTHANDSSNRSMIEIMGFVAENSGSHASYIVEKIKSIQSISPNNNIAILVRSRSHLTSIVPALKNAGISYHAIDIDPLNKRQSVQDLLSLTCALIHPGDRIAWLSILRAPWCGLKLSDLAILSADKNTFICDEIASILNNNPDVLSKDAKSRLLRIWPIIKSANNDRHRLPLRLWIEKTWILLGGPACIQSENELEDCEVFFKLLEKINDSNNHQSIDHLKEKMESIYASTADNNATVQISTIHSSKGLEYDTVILPHLEKKMPNDDKSLLVWMEHPLSRENIALLLAPISSAKNNENKLYDYINRQQKIKARHESDRLLYVAATRAKKNLILTYLLNPDARQQVSGSFYEKIKPFTDESLIKQESENQVTIENNDKPITRLVEYWKNPIQLTSLDENPKHQTHDGFSLPNIYPRIIGNVLHILLQQLASRGVSWWNEHATDKKRAYLRQQLRNHSMPTSEEKRACSEIELAIQNIMSDQRGLWIFQAHHDMACEFPVSALINGQAENMVIDRTFICENGIRWIIDYKTSKPGDSENVDHFIDNEKRIYQKQMDKYAIAMQSITDKPIKLALYFPLVPAWAEY